MNQRTSIFVLGGTLASILIAAACGASKDNGTNYGYTGGAGGGVAVAVASSSSSSSTGQGGMGGMLPPEHEDESHYGAPVATGHYVWIANPTSGRIAYIDAKTLEIKLIDAGNGPTYLAPIPDPHDDVAIVINVLSNDATVLRAPAGESLTSVTLPLTAAPNAWAVSKDGRFAIAWTDTRQVQNPDPVDGYQDITVLDLAAGMTKSYPLTVGYRPVAIGFDDASLHAYAVTQDGVSVVSLAGGSEPAVVRNIKLSDQPADPKVTQDVSITPDGAYALVRRDAVNAIGMVSLADGTRVDVPLPGAPTDLDLMPDGSIAVAVVRDTQQVALVPIPGAFTSPDNVELVPAGSLVGSTSLARKSSVGFFYTNAIPNRILTTIDTKAASPAAKNLLMRAPIQAVFPTPSAANAVILHDALDTEGSHYAAALSIAPIALDLPAKLWGLHQPTIAIAVAESHALVASGDDVAQAYTLTLADMPSLHVHDYPLASLPIAAGIIEGAGRGYVAQKHPDGRITFIDLDTGDAHTITGFELSTQVVDGTKP